jgi:probable biosynthetic protein (TIGR04098 family)
MPDPSVLTRTEVVRPAMCGHNALFVGQIGDWTWDAVSALCGTDVLRARDPSGAPTYLSFYYYRLRGSHRFHPQTPTFGDRLHVTTRLFDFGSESVLTLHRIERTRPGAPQPAPRPVLEPAEFYAFGDQDCLYVENFNRWVTRSDARSNQDLVRSSPLGFRHGHLPGLPAAYSPRLACQRARSRLTFLAEESGEHRRAGGPFQASYEVDPSRDLNGVGLLYFASYFSIVDWALLRLWRHLGRDDRSFLDRVVVDQQLCYLGNADAGSRVDATLQRWQPAAGAAGAAGVAGDRHGEAIDVVLRERGSGRLLAVSTLRLLAGETR